MKTFKHPDANPRTKLVVCPYAVKRLCCGRWSNDRTMPYCGHHKWHNHNVGCGGSSCGEFINAECKELDYGLNRNLRVYVRY